MNITIVLAQIFGILLAVTGLSMLVNKKSMSAALTEAGQNQGFLWMLGFVALMMGAVFVVLSNVWNGGNMALVVTIIGWLILLKGIFILWFPSAAGSLYRKCTGGTALVWWGAIVFIVGLVLLYKGFM